MTMKMMQIKTTVAMGLLFGSLSFTLTGCPAHSDENSNEENSSKQHLLSSLLVEGLPAVYEYNGTSDLNDARIVRNQGQRPSCTAFGAIGALEMELKHAGYGDVDLSENYLASISAMDWVHPLWDGWRDENITNLFGYDYKESKVYVCGGGGGVSNLELLTRIKIPKEQYMPYHNDYGSDTNFCTQSRIEQNLTQYQTSTLNFSRIPQSAFNAPRYFGVNSLTELSNNELEDNRVFERILRSEHPIVVDVHMNQIRQNSIIWQKNDEALPTGDHSMLIVGYDKNAGEAHLNYYIVKNSWGETRNDSGLTYISYEAMHHAIYGAGYITNVSVTNNKRPERFMGRWNVSADGHKGVLDIYHIPGHITSNILDFLQTPFYEDHRLGTYYDTQGNAYKVNGTIENDTLTWYLDTSNPNPHLDTLQGQKFEYQLYDNDRWMAGTHTNSDGTKWGGFATKENNAITNNYGAIPYSIDDIEGDWNLTLGSMNPADSIILHLEHFELGALSGTANALNSSFNVVGEMGREYPNDSRDIHFRIEGLNISFDMYRLTHQSKIAAGSTTGNAALMLKLDN